MRQRYNSTILLLILAAFAAVPEISRAQVASSSICCCDGLDPFGTFCYAPQADISFDDIVNTCNTHPALLGTALPWTFEDTTLEWSCNGHLADDCASACAIGLPVELTSFDALVTAESVLLKWSTSSETNNSGFSIEREVASDSFDEIAFVSGRGNTSEPSEYTYAIRDIDPGVHRFRLKQVDFDGAFEYSQTVEALVTVPDQFLIEPAYPNPFNPTTTVRFAVSAEQLVRVTLVNAAGQSVRTILNRVVAADQMHELIIDAGELPSGTYLVRFDGPGVSATESIILAK